jgi:acetamidase/formamidase
VIFFLTQFTTVHRRVKGSHPLPTLTVDPGEEFTVEVRWAFDHIEDIAAVPTPFTPACDGHPLAPIAGPIVVRGAKPGDVVAIDLIELTPFGFDAGRSTKGAGIRRRGLRFAAGSPLEESGFELAVKTPLKARRGSPYRSLS